jgi:CRISPR-associated protein Cas5
MGNISLKILETPPRLEKNANLIIEPLAPLSMVSDLPGSFYKSLTSPSKKMLCGLLENLLGWHIDIADRMAIQKELIKLRKKQKINYEKPQQGSTYIPLLIDYFEIELVTIPLKMHYNDLWSKAYRRADADVHPKGTINISYELIKEKRERKRDEKKPMQIAGEELLNIFKNNVGKFPLYYTTPTNREYVHFKQPIEITIKIDTSLIEIVKNEISVNNCLYLGNSEGWINLKIKDHD